MNKKSKTNQRSEKRALRADRNRMRTIKHVHRLLERVAEGASHGFNHFSWTDAADAYRQLSSFLSLEEYQAIGRAWSDTYATDDLNNNVKHVVSLIKERFDGQTYSTQE